MAPLRILVVGASIAGPAFASFLLLSDLKAHITLLERAPGVRAEGQNIDLRGQGLQCARRLGLEQTIRANLTGEKGVVWVDAQDQAIASISASKPGEAQGPTADVEMLRGTLAKLVVERCEKLSEQSKSIGGGEVEIIYDDYLAELEQDGDSVRVKFANSKRQRMFDLVVGADGLQSRTRRQAFGAEGEADRLHKLGIYGGFFSTPADFSIDGWRRWFHATKQRGVMLRPSDRPGRTTVFMHIKSYDKRFTDVAVGSNGVAAQKTLLRETFSDAGWHIDRLLEEMDLADDFYYDMIAQVKMDKWSKGRVVLIGDAAHCATPLSGRGTSLALTGAYNLAGALAQHPNDIEAAFDQYEQTQRPQLDKAQSLSPMVNFIFSLDAAWQLWLTNYLVAVLSYMVVIFKLLFYFAGPSGVEPDVREYGFRVPPEELEECLRTAEFV